MSRGPLAVAALAVPVAALVVVAVVQARAHPELAPGGEGPWPLGVQLAAGLALVVAALDAARRREAELGGALLAAATGLALHALPAPPDGALLFTLALLGGGLAPAGAAHAALVYPRRRRPRCGDRGLHGCAGRARAVAGARLRPAGGGLLCVPGEPGARARRRRAGRLARHVGPAARGGDVARARGADPAAARAAGPRRRARSPPLSRLPRPQRSPSAPSATSAPPAAWRPTPPTATCGSPPPARSG